MKKKDFLKQLRQHLKHLQKEELDEVLADYEEHIDIGVSEGRSEKEVIKTLGTPKTIAKHVTAYTHLKKAKEERTTGNILRAVVSTIGIGFFNIIFVLGPFLAIIGVLIGFFGVGASLFVGGLVGFFGLLINAFEPGIPMNAAIMFMIALISGGGLVLIGSYYLAKLFAILTLKYLKLNIKVVKKLEGSQ